MKYEYRYNPRHKLAIYRISNETDRVEQLYGGKWYIRYIHVVGPDYLILDINNIPDTIEKTYEDCNEFHLVKKELFYNEILGESREV